MGLHAIDGIVLVGYLLGITLLGLRIARWIESARDYFMPRRFGPAMMIANAFGTGTASDQAVVVASATFRSGLSGIWWQWIWLPATPFYWVIAPIMRRLRAVTTADVYALRFGNSVATLFSIVGIVGLSVKIGLLLKGAGALLDACTAGAISANVAMAIITVLMAIYGTAGGLSAAIVTDFLQAILTLIFSFILLPFVLHSVGGMSGIRETVQDPNLLSLMVKGEIDAFFVIMFAMQSLLGIVAQPFIMGVCASGRTEMDGRIGFMFGNIVKRICTMAWSVTALGALAWYLQQGVDLSQVEADHVYGDVARAFLPSVMPGLLGLFLASLIASVMSSCDAFMISSSALITENLYRPLYPGRSDKHYINVGRVAGLGVVAGGIWFAYRVPNVMSALALWLKIAPMMGIAFWMGLFWRRMTAAGAWATTLTGFATWFLVTRGVFVNGLQGLSGTEALHLLKFDPNGVASIRQPWQILIYTSAAILAGIIVSLMTKPVEDGKLDTFYALTRTPVQPGEEVERPCSLPIGVPPAERRMLVQSWGLEIPCPSRTSVAGWLGGWFAVLLLVGGFVWLVQ